ncbi:uncharacterized protein BJ171DRAFT_595097 [Polychytrium aggregatum]|uniref:uncharacterized protein n=1 Tax=Polychytrium aggregatum TaxID=110093 RepID=UPI0022FE019B|nr:uncharacterized protein BJ171DRAFT_595097 [Polychytrium aggregatum]KAI9209346.1 hypothetical protein BJ171DRAFT_595097 [Polychytrium aggregatum]
MWSNSRPLFTPKPVFATAADSGASTPASTQASTPASTQPDQPQLSYAQDPLPQQPIRPTTSSRYPTYPAAAPAATGIAPSQTTGLPPYAPVTPPSFAAPPVGPGTLGSTFYGQQPPLGPPPSATPLPGSASTSSSSISYQGKVVGLGGWNDTPAHMTSKVAAVPVAELQGIQDPKGLIVSKTTNMLAVVSSAYEQDPAQRRVIADTSKRIDELFAKLGDGVVSDAVVAYLVGSIQALDARDSVTASSYVAKLMSGHFDQDGRWIVGYKRLVELYQKLL